MGQATATRVNTDNELHEQAERLSEFDRLVDHVSDLLLAHSSDPKFDESSQIHLGKMMKYLRFVKAERFVQCRDYLVALTRILSGDKPNIAVVGDIVQQIRIEFWRSRPGVWGWFVVSGLVGLLRQSLNSHSWISTS